MRFDKTSYLRMATSNSKTKENKSKEFQRFKKPPKLTIQSEKAIIADFDDSVSIVHLPEGLLEVKVKVLR